MGPEKHLEGEEIGYNNAAVLKIDDC